MWNSLCFAFAWIHNIQALGIFSWHIPAGLSFLLLLPHLLLLGLKAERQLLMSPFPERKIPSLGFPRLSWELLGAAVGCWKNSSRAFPKGLILGRAEQVKTWATAWDSFESVLKWPNWYFHLLIKFKWLKTGAQSSASPSPCSGLQEFYLFPEIHRSHGWGLPTFHTWPTCQIPDK